MSWCMGWKILAVAMIFPTVLVSIYVLNKVWNVFAERIHNFAVLFWIIANSYWMLTELFLFDKMKVPMLDITYEQLSIVPFGNGLIILILYYTGILNSKIPK